MAVIRVADLESSRFRLAALDLPTGKRWFLDEAAQFILRGTPDGDPQVALTRDRLIAWDDDTIQTVRLDGQVERVLFRAEWPFSAPILSPAGDLLAFTLVPRGPQDTGAVVVIDLHSGEEVFRLSGDDSRIPSHGKLELERWSTDGGTLLVSAVWSSVRPAAHVVLLPEEVRSTTEFAFSPDLRYLVGGRLLSPENYGSDVLLALERVRVLGKAWVESLEIVEVDTGRELAVVMHEGSILVHVVGPVDGRVVYQTVPVSALPLDTDEAADSYAYENAVYEAILESLVVHVFDLATGSVTPMDQLDRNLRDALELAWLREENVDHLASIGHCLETLSAPTACDSAGEMYDRIYSERDADREPLWRLLGFIWLD